MTFQAWKVKLINFMTFQVFHELYEPWPIFWTTLNINGSKTKQLRSVVTRQLNFKFNLPRKLTYGIFFSSEKEKLICLWKKIYICTKNFTIIFRDVFSPFFQQS